METDLRTTGDRRRRPTPMISRYTFFGGRRRRSRRAGDPQAIYVDRLGWKLSSALALIFLFQCLDALFTLVHVSHGARELNPVMSALLRIGPGTFVSSKLAVAGVGLSFLGLHRNFPAVRTGITVLFLLYAGVVGYHFVLLWRP